MGERYTFGLPKGAAGPSAIHITVLRPAKTDSVTEQRGLPVRDPPEALFCLDAMPRNLLGCSLLSRTKGGITCPKS